MLTEQEKLGFVLSAIRKMADPTLRFLTQVIGVVDPRSGDHRGSGIFCMIGGRPAVVTAAHVLDKMSEEGRYESVAFSRGSGQAPAIVSGKIRYFRDYDLAVYLPEANFPLGPDKEYWPEGRICRDAKVVARDYLFLHGFPGRFSRPYNLGDSPGSLHSEALAYGAMTRLSERDLSDREKAQFVPDFPGEEILPGDFLAEHQFAFNFSTEPANFLDPDGGGGVPSERTIKDWSDVFVDNGPPLPGLPKTAGAEGLSGSPVWRIGAPDGPVREWTPTRSELVGIVTNWDSEKKILIATLATKLLEVAHEF